MQREPLRLHQLLADFRLLMILFISFRVMMLLAYQPFFIDGNERGVGTGGDRLYYYQLTALADEGYLPFRDWWSEFPPLLYVVTTGVYLGLGQSATYDTWSLIMGLLSVASETGVLLLLYAIASKLHGKSTAIALSWVYAVLFMPIVFAWWNMNTFVLFFLLLGLYWMIRNQDMRSAIAIAIGALFKFVPILAIGAAIRFWHPERALRYVAIALGFFALVYVPFFMINSETASISLTVQFGKPSYQTIWALIDGNYTTGNFGAVEERLDPSSAANADEAKNPSVVPGWLRLGVAALIGLFVFMRVRRFDDRGMIAFVAITLLIFYLQSQGWSPQWLAEIIVLTLLIFPTRDGVLVCIMLSFLALIEYPFIFIRTAETGGYILPAHPMFWPWVGVVVLRTLVLIGLAVALYQKLRQPPLPEGVIRE
ncbi:hypothetical protein G4Y79_12850 [Phototrophicus methaneseepsis]|uniref:DUF2029 domain-containing protein n=1 Tax=Phototrophicus methaneseepsis TaxID=2710758 RepID=A0A7S8E580_9CHLR|nr:hypothetical protein [Phototrophicus methaneseepsis]QPC80601.1 hypothetical protein G4Y79_12850 [Phototrophicus methaneseepsis]